MDTQHEKTDAPQRRPGSAFRRIGVTVAVACVVTGSIAGLGAMGALAAPSTSPSATSSQASASVPKTTYTEADLAAFAASPYADDALNLAVVWGVDTTTAKGKAGAKIKAGAALPFPADKATTMVYSAEEKASAFFTAGTQKTVSSDFTQALGLAVAWGSPSAPAAKSKIGDLLLMHKPVPAAPTSFTADQEAAAFTLVGYGDDEATQLAGLWQTDTRSAKVKAGTALLAGKDLPL